MNDFVLIGKIVNTFGIKGELKLKSDFNYIEKVLVNGFKLYIGPSYELAIFNSFRIHKGYYMIKLNGYDNINDVLKYKGLNIFVKREDLNLKSDEYLFSDLIGYEVYDNDLFIGIVKDYIINNVTYLKVALNKKDFFIPMVQEYIKKIDKEEKKITTNKGSELIL